MLLLCKRSSCRRCAGHNSLLYLRCTRNGRVVNRPELIIRFMAKKKKIRVELRKNRSKPPRQHDLTRGFQKGEVADEAAWSERIRAKGELSRKRTIITEDTGDATGQEPAEMPAVDVSQCLAGRVLRVHGLQSVVERDDGRQ